MCDWRLCWRKARSAPTSGDSRRYLSAEGMAESAKRQGFRDVVSYITLQQLAHEICTRSPPELVRDASVPTALLEQRVVFILPDDMPRHVWFFRLKGRTGTVASQLSGNSVTDLRVPVLMDDGQLHDIQIEYLRKTPGNHSLTYVNGGSRKRLSKRRTARYPRRSVYPDGSAKAQLEAINSTITNDIGLHRTSDAKLREANAPPRFLTVATSNYFHWLCHLHANLQHLGYDSGDLGVCVFFAETEHEIRAMGIKSSSFQPNNEQYKRRCNLRKPRFQGYGDWEANASGDAGHAGAERHIVFDGDIRYSQIR